MDNSLLIKRIDELFEQKEYIPSDKNIEKVLDQLIQGSHHIIYDNI